MSSCLTWDMCCVETLDHALSCSEGKISEVLINQQFCSRAVSELERDVETLVTVCAAGTNSGTRLTHFHHSVVSLDEWVFHPDARDLCTIVTWPLCCCVAVETWAWPAALTAPSAWPRRRSAKTTSLRSQRVWTEWRSEWLWSGIKLWWARVVFY